MDKRQPLTREEALALVRRYKEVISPRFAVEPKVFMFYDSLRMQLQRSSIPPVLINT